MECVKEEEAVWRLPVCILRKGSCWPSCTLTQSVTYRAAVAAATLAFTHSQGQHWGPSVFFCATNCVWGGVCVCVYVCVGGGDDAVMLHASRGCCMQAGSVLTVEAFK